MNRRCERHATRLGPRRVRLVSGWLVALALALATSSLAQVQVGEVTFGHEGHCRELHWTQVVVELVNPGDSDVQGKAFVEVPKQAGAPYRYTQRVDMPPKAHKRINLYPYTGSIAGAGVFLAGFEPTRGGRVQAEVNAQMEQASDLLVLVCTESPPHFNFIRAIDTRTWMPTPPGSGATSSYSPADIYVAYTTTSGLPDSWKGFDDLDLLVMEDFSPETMSRAQEAAIIEWIVTGGRVLVTGGEDYRRVADSFLAPYLPVAVSGSRTFAEGLPSLSQRFGGRMDSLPVAVTEGKAVRGRVWLGQDGTPLLASCGLGSGTLWQTAFSFGRRPVLQWDSAGEVFSLVLKHGRQYQPGLIGHHSEADTARALSSHAGPNPPSFQVISIFLLLYIICLVPVNYLVLKRLDRRELAWITTPGIVVVFSLAAYALGFVLKGSAVQLQAASLLEVQASSGAAHAQSYYALFSPRKQLYNVSFAVERVAAWVPSVAGSPYTGSLPEEARLDAPFEVASGERDRIEGLLVQMWDQQTFAARGPVVLSGAMPGELRVGAGQMLSGSLGNQLGVDLEGCVVAFRDQVATLGDIPQGATANVSLTGVRPKSTADPPPKEPGWSLAGGAFSGPGISVMATPTPDPVLANVYSALVGQASPVVSAGARRGSARTPEGRKRDLAEGLLRQNVYTLRDDEVLLFAWASVDPLGADIGRHHVDRDGNCLVVVHVPVYSE